MRKVKAGFAALCATLSVVGTAGVCSAQETWRTEDLPTYTDSLGIEFMHIPAGTVLVETGKNMFDEPVFGIKAAVSQPFYLGKYEVTQEQWAAVMGSNPATYKGRRNPVENVSWNEVQEFITRLNALEGHNYRLPTEMEWELAVRGDGSSRYFFGESEDALGDYAWFGENSKGRTQSVGQKEPNRYGLYDVYGNVREWMQDWHAAYPDSPEVTDYSGPNSGSGHVIRGGGWANTVDDFRSASRNDAKPGAKSDSLGLRLAMSHFELPTYTNSMGMQFLLIPAGSFQVADSDIKAVVSKPFYLGTCEVTQEQWTEVMGENPSYYEGTNLPVDSVSWEDVQEFITRLNAREGHNRYRLPTEHEWELAARAGTSTTRFFGKTVAPMRDYAWFGDNARLVTHPVGTKLPNPYGLYDMYGNVWEWTQDWYAPYPEIPELVDYSGPETDPGKRRVTRGGSWNNAAGFCRSGARSSYLFTNRVTGVGFRLAMTPE